MLGFFARRPVHGIKRWSYMATVMADVLEHAAEQRRYHRAEMPTAVLRSAQRFFASVQEAKSGTAPADPEASVENYSIAAEALLESEELGEQLDASLARYATLIQLLEADRTFSRKEANEVARVAEFFRGVAAAGEEAYYSDYMAATEFPTQLA